MDVLQEVFQPEPWIPCLLNLATCLAHHSSSTSSFVSNNLNASLSSSFLGPNIFPRTFCYFYHDNYDHYGHQCNSLNEAEKLIVSQLFMEPKGSLLCSHGAATGPCPEGVNPFCIAPTYNSVFACCFSEHFSQKRMSHTTASRRN